MTNTIRPRKPTQKELAARVPALEREALLFRMGLTATLTEKPDAIAKATTSYNDRAEWRYTFTLYRATSASGGFVVERAHSCLCDQRDSFRVYYLDDMREMFTGGGWNGYEVQTAIGELLATRQRLIDQTIKGTRDSATKRMHV